MGNLINFEVRPLTERNELGTVAEIAGKGATINFVKENFLNTDKRLYVILKRQDGSSQGFTCSPRVGQLVRGKEITLKQLAGFPICEAVTEDGSATFAQIQMPSGEGLINAGDISSVEEYQAPAFDPSELVAF